MRRRLILCPEEPLEEHREMREDFRRRMNHCRKNTNRSFCLLFVNKCRWQQQWTVQLINCSSLSFSSLQSIMQEWRTFNLEAGLRWAHQIWIDALQSGKKRKTHVSITFEMCVALDLSFPAADAEGFWVRKPTLCRLLLFTALSPPCLLISCHVNTLCLCFVYMKSC